MIPNFTHFPSGYTQIRDETEISLRVKLGPKDKRVTSYTQIEDEKGIRGSN